MTVTPDRWTARYSRAVSIGYVLYELLRARLSRKRGMRILFSNVPAAMRQLEKWFSHTRHVIESGELREDVLGDYDLVVPLHEEDVVHLATLRQRIEKNPIPLPPDRAVEITCDKLLFHRSMERSGFADFVPRVGDDVGYPCLLKKRVDVGGRNSFIVGDASQEWAVLEGIDPGDFLRQEYIEGRFEYTTHALVIDGRIARSLTIRYDMGSDGVVKGPVQPILRTIVPSAHLGIFRRMLSSLDYVGLANIDFKLRNGRPMVMEINPRMGGSLAPYFFSFVRSLPVPAASGRRRSEPQVAS